MGTTTLGPRIFAVNNPFQTLEAPVARGQRSHSASFELAWVQGYGGPLVLVPRRLLSLWGGVERSSAPGVADDEESDFDRALAIEQELGVIKVGDGEALVLGDEGYETTWWRLLAAGGGLLCRQLWGEDEAVIIDALRDLAEASWVEEALSFDADDGRLALVDAVSAGDDAQEILELTLAPGRHGLATANVEPDAEHCLLLHRLLPMQ